MTFIFKASARHQGLHSFPTRRSSDLAVRRGVEHDVVTRRGPGRLLLDRHVRQAVPVEDSLDRKSTRLNSSHANSSYAVFCLKKKSQTDTQKYTSQERTKRSY